MFGGQDLLDRFSMWLWRQRNGADPDLGIILDAAGGEQVDPDDLAEAYWRMYYGTYLPREEWHALPRGKRKAIYRTRLHLINAYAGFSPEQQEHVTRNRPPAPKF